MTHKLRACNDNWAVKNDWTSKSLVGIRHVTKTYVNRAMQFTTFSKLSFSEVSLSQNNSNQTTENIHIELM